MVNAVSNWDINEITLDVQGSHVLLLEEPRNRKKFTHGLVAKAQVCLTLQEAKELLVSLGSAIEQYDGIDRLAESEGEGK